MSGIEFHLLFTSLIASVSALAVHILVMKWTGPRLAALAGREHVPERYPLWFNGAAFLTAFISALVPVTVYFYVGKSLPIDSFILRGIILSAILLEIKGKLFREPVMNYLYFKKQKMNTPCFRVILTFADQWAANIVLGFLIVGLSPIRG